MQDFLTLRCLWHLLREELRKDRGTEERRRKKTRIA